MRRTSTRAGGYRMAPICEQRPASPLLPWPTARTCTQLPHWRTQWSWRGARLLSISSNARLAPLNVIATGHSIMALTADKQRWWMPSLWLWRLAIGNRY